MYNSQICQDAFVDKFLNIDNGFFVDIGAGTGGLPFKPLNPGFYSNTYYLEKFRNWNGYCFDIDPEFCNQAKNFRKNVFCEDVSEDNFYDLLTLRMETDFSQNSVHIDYLSLDVDNVQEKVFDLIDFSMYRPTIITLETNVFTGKESDLHFAQKSKEQLLDLNFELVAENVVLAGYGPVENWFYDKEKITTKQFFYNKDCKFIINNLEQGKIR